MRLRLTNNIIVPLFVLAMLLSGSCTKWLQDVPTDDRIMEEELFNSQSGFLTAVNGIYIDILSEDLYGSKLTFAGTDLMAQYWNADLTSSVTHDYKDLVDITNSAKDSLSTQIWRKAYVTINNVNNILKHCESTTILTEAQKELYKGEMLAMRAMLHFELYRFFSTSRQTPTNNELMPYADSHEFIIYEVLTSDEVVERIIKDLKEAEVILKQYDPIIASGPALEEVVGEDNDNKFRNNRLNYYAAKALIARVSVFVGDDQTAYEYASSVVAETVESNSYFPFITRDLIEDAEDPDRVFSTEMIFGLYNTRRGDDIYNEYFSASLEKDELLSMSNAGVLDLYDGVTTDFRYQVQWEGKADKYNAIIPTFAKYMQNAPAYSDLLIHNYYVPIIRISEMCLICAETKYISEPDVAAKYLTMLRTGRNLPLVAATDDMLPVIIAEYQREFIGEGQLFWFYKRHNMLSIPVLYVAEGETSQGGDPLVYNKPMDTGQYDFTLPREQTDFQ